MIRCSLALLVLCPIVLIAGHTALEAPPAKPEQSEATATEPAKTDAPKPKKIYEDEWHVLNTEKQIPLEKALQKRCKLLTLKEKIKVALDIMTQIANREKEQLAVMGKGKTKAKPKTVFARKKLGTEGIVVNIGTNLNNKHMVQAVVTDLIASPTATNAQKQTGTVHKKKALKKIRLIKLNTRFVPPEITGKGKISRKSAPSADIFSLGCTFWKMYFGKEPGWVKANQGHLCGSKRNQYESKAYLINSIRQREFSSIPKNPKMLTRDHRFLQAILHMTNPTAEARGNAAQAFALLYHAYTGRPLADVLREIQDAEKAAKKAEAKKAKVEEAAKKAEAKKIKADKSHKDRAAKK